MVCAPEQQRLLPAAHVQQAIGENVARAPGPAASCTSSMAEKVDVGMRGIGSTVHTQ
jgi:hypothetical protein